RGSSQPLLKQPDLVRQLIEVTQDQTPLTAAMPEIGREPVLEEELEEAKIDLGQRPPQQFDLARRVRVYQSRVQFVELSLRGCRLGRHTISVPPGLLPLSSDPTIQGRLQTTFRLIERNSHLSSEALEREKRRIEKFYLRSLGERFGVIILRQQKENFLKEVEI